MAPDTDPYRTLGLDARRHARRGRRRTGAWPRPTIPTRPARRRCHGSSRSRRPTTRSPGPSGATSDRARPGRPARGDRGIPIATAPRRRVEPTAAGRGGRARPVGRERRGARRIDGERPPAGAPGARPPRPDRPPKKATLGSTSYDGADAEPFEPDWGGASWYGTTSGTYWTLNPKEYADPRKHGPEYQARARRGLRGADEAGVDPGRSAVGGASAPRRRRRRPTPAATTAALRPPLGHPYDLVVVGGDGRHATRSEAAPSAAGPRPPGRSGRADPARRRRRRASPDGAAGPAPTTGPQRRPPARRRMPRPRAASAPASRRRASSRRSGVAGRRSSRRLGRIGRAIVGLGADRPRDRLGGRRDLRLRAIRGRLRRAAACPLARADRGPRDAPPRGPARPDRIGATLATWPPRSRPRSSFRRRAARTTRPPAGRAERLLVIAWVVGLVFGAVRESAGRGCADAGNRGRGPEPSRILRTMPRRHDPRDLSAAAQEYLLALRVSAGAEDGTRVTAAQIARHLGVTTQAASEMFRRLVADGLVDHADGRELRLTTAGRAVADAIFRRHALLEWLLTSVIGLGWAESDEEAMRLQGAISPRVEARLDEMLGHPETCPHGNPIDAATAKRRPRASACPRSRPVPARPSTGSPRRPRRTPACSRTSRRVRSSPARRSRSSPAPNRSIR